MRPQGLIAWLLPYSIPPPADSDGLRTSSDTSHRGSRMLSLSALHLSSPTGLCSCIRFGLCISPRLIGESLRDPLSMRHGKSRCGLGWCLHHHCMALESTASRCLALPSLAVTAAVSLRVEGHDSPISDFLADKVFCFHPVLQVSPMAFSFGERAKSTTPTPSMVAQHTTETLK